MNVLIDWRVFFAPSGGTYRTIMEVLPRLVQNHGIHLGFLCRTRKNDPPIFPRSLSFALPFPLSLFPEGKLKDLAWSMRIRGMTETIFHTPYYSFPPTEKIPSVATYHDLIPELFPQNNTGKLFDQLRYKKKELASRSTRIIAVSNATKKDFCSWYEESHEKVDVIPLGVNYNFFSTKISYDDEKKLKLKMGIEGPFLLVVGGRDSHKNFLNFLACFSASTLKEDFTLVTAGMARSPEETARIESLGVSRRTKHLNLPSENELQTLYQSCAALVYPSLYEGFGLPPLEAMAAGAPVALANTSSMPEVCGEAGHYFDPNDLSSMAKVTREAAEGGRLSQKVQLGIERAKRFTWEETARLTALSYKKALDEFE